jgi:hypothetical protein
MSTVAFLKFNVSTMEISKHIVHYIYSEKFRDLYKKEILLNGPDLAGAVRNSLSVKRPRRPRNWSIETAPYRAWFSYLGPTGILCEIAASSFQRWNARFQIIRERLFSALSGELLRVRVAPAR